MSAAHIDPPPQPNDSISITQTQFYQTRPQSIELYNNLNCARQLDHIHKLTNRVEMWLWRTEIVVVGAWQLAR